MTKPTRKFRPLGASRHVSILVWFALLVVPGSFVLSPVASAQAPAARVAESTSLRGVLLPVSETTTQRLQREKRRGMNTVVLSLSESGPTSRMQIAEAAERVEQAGLDLAYWIEVARCPELAEQHPEWMASLQGHDQWRRFFPNVPPAGSDEVTKVYPWVPILYEESFQGQLQRIRSLLADRPPVDTLLLNDLQGAPSACGCGNTLCRWTTDYGPIRTATSLDDSAAAKFLGQVAKLLPETNVIPVWVTECEEHDGAADGMCAGVGCFRGICWKAYTRQLMPVAKVASQVGVLLPTIDFQRKDTVYGAPAGWVTAALKSFQTMPPNNGGEAMEPSRFVAVVQGWGTDEDFVAAQIQAASDAGVRQFVVAYEPIEQGWEPRVLKQSDLVDQPGETRE